jgi:hypothetical protein
MMGGMGGYPDSKKWGVRSPERGILRSEALDYYDGEEWLANRVRASSPSLPRRMRASGLRRAEVASATPAGSGGRLGWEPPPRLSPRSCRQPMCDDLGRCQLLSKLRQMVF